MLPKKYIVTNSKPVNVGHTYVQWLTTILGSSLFLEYGFQIGWVSPMKKVLQADGSPIGTALTDTEMTFVACTATFVAIITTPLSTFIAELYGRKTCIIMTMSVNALSWIIKLSANHTAFLIASRICSGFTLGGCYGVIPLYVREISQDSLRGTLLSFSMSFTHFGVLSMYSMGSYLGYYKTLWIVLSISIVTLLLMLFAPESPVFLVKREKYDLATKTVATLRGLNIDDLNVQNEINRMINEDLYYKSLEKITLITIFKNKAWRRGYILCQTIIVCVGFNGTFGIVTYAWTILTEAGVSASPELQTLLVPILMMFSAIVPMACIEKTGRKLLLVGTQIVSAISLVLLASALLAQRSGVAVSSWVHVVTIAITVSAYSAGVLPIPNVIMIDIFKFQVIFFDLVANSLGLHSVFYVCAGVNLLGALVVIAFVPETKGRTINQIEAILAGEKTDSATNS